MNRDAVDNGAWPTTPKSIHGGEHALIYDPLLAEMIDPLRQVSMMWDIVALTESQGPRP